AFDFCAHTLARALAASAAHHGLPRGGAGTRPSDRGVRLADHDPIDAELRPDDLGHDGIDALAHLHGGGLDLGDRALTVNRDPHPCLRRIVETFAVRQVLVADRHADAAFDRFTVTDIPGATRK